jgi:hypothetical protein
VARFLVGTTTDTRRFAAAGTAWVFFDDSPSCTDAFEYRTSPMRWGRFYC